MSIVFVYQTVRFCLLEWCLFGCSFPYYPVCSAVLILDHSFNFCLIVFMYRPFQCQDNHLCAGQPPLADCDSSSAYLWLPAVSHSGLLLSLYLCIQCLNATFSFTLGVHRLMEEDDLNNGMGSELMGMCTKDFEKRGGSDAKACRFYHVDDGVAMKHVRHGVTYRNTVQGVSRQAITRLLCLHAGCAH